MAERRSPVGLLGLFAVAFGFCCGFPILVSVDATGAIAGLSFASWVVIAASAGIVAVGFWRLARRRPLCDVLFPRGRRPADTGALHSRARSLAEEDDP